MKFVLVNGRKPRMQSHCAFCCEPLGEGYVRELTRRRLSYCDHKCYCDHLNVAARRPQAQARAS